MKSTEKQPIVLLNNVRLSFPSLFEPKAKTPGSAGKPKFEATFILDKQANAADIAKMRAAINEVYAKAKDVLFKGKKPKHVCLREGSEKDLDGYSERNMFVSARNINRPEVVDRKRNKLIATDPQAPYAGCYVNASIQIYPFVHPESGPMICAQLRVVQFVKDGEPFGQGPIKADEEVSELPDDDSAVDSRPASSADSLV